MKNFNSLVNKILMTESPIFSNSELSVNLNNNQTNKEALDQCFKNGKKLQNFKEWEVFEIQKEEFKYFCFTRNNIVEAYAEFVVDGQNTNSKRVLQKKSINAKGLLREAFLHYFSHLFSSITLDKVANTHGKEFFKKLMKEAHDLGFKTTVFDEKTKNEALYQPESFEQYWSDKTIIHNKAVGYYNLLFKIYYK